MSVEDAHKFYEATTRDPKLYDAVKKAKEVIVHIAQSHGYDFTHEELNEALASRWDADFEKDNPNPDEPMTCCCF